jgi:hypothetical protein
MFYDPTEQLKRFRDITPDPAFVARTRAALLAAAPVSARSRFFAPFFRIAGAVAVLAGIVGGSSLLFPTRPVLSSSLNPDSLREEIQKTIAIQVREIQYEAVSNQTIATAIEEIKNTEADHLNPAVISEEAANALLPGESTTTLQIDALLEELSK